MTVTKKFVRSWRVARVEAALLAGHLLCSANYTIDYLLDRLGTTGSKTILNDVVIGILGALTVFFFLSASHEKQRFDSAKQRMVLIADLNWRVREAFGVVAASALSDDRFARLRGIDEATDSIDTILSEFIVFREQHTRESEEQKERVRPIIR
jgi:hypothetical protein